MKLWRSWVERTSSVESGTSVALFRIAIGACVLLTLGSVAWADLVDVIWVDQAYGGLRKLGGNWLVKALGGATPGVIWGLFAVGILSGTSLMVGAFGRVSALIALLATQALVDINSHAGGSYDQLLQNGLWLTVITPCSHTLSVDCRRRTGAWSDPTPIGAWARYLIAFQLVVVYTSTGWQKLSAYWTPGGDFSALYYILQQPSWQHRDMRWLAYVFPVTQAATAVSWLWEVTNPIWLLALWFADTPGEGRVRTWFRRLRVRHVYLALGVVFHVSILLTMNVGPFGPISLAFYAAMVLPAEWERLGAGLVGQGKALGFRASGGSG